MLVETIKKLFRKYIYSPSEPHYHEWEYYRAVESSSSGFGQTFMSTDHFAKCSCGEIKEITSDELTT